MLISDQYKTREILNIIWNKYATSSFVFLFVQQLIVASSTLWVAYLGSAIASNQEYRTYLYLFIISLLIVYLPHMGAMFYLSKARSFALKKYVTIFSKCYKRKPTLRLSLKARHEHEPWLINEGQATINEAHHLIYDSFSLLLNTLLNIGALCAAINSSIIIGYLASFVIFFAMLKPFKRPLEKSALNSQNARKSLTQILTHGWDNITIGNLYNYNLWRHNFKDRWEKYKSSELKLVLWTNTASSLNMFWVTCPIVINLVWLFHTHSTNVALLAALVATLPRQILILQHFHIFSSYLMSWHGVRSKLSALVGSVSEVHDANDLASERITWKDINISFNKKTIPIQSFEEMMDLVTKSHAGLISIRGRNGSGKSTIMNLLAKNFNEGAILLPAKSKLLFKNSLNDNLSTGEEFKECFNEISEYINNKKRDKKCLLLLDEWDANLDANNASTVSDSIKVLSKNMLVVEVRHVKERMDS